MELINCTICGVGALTDYCVDCEGYRPEEEELPPNLGTLSPTPEEEDYVETETELECLECGALGFGCMSPCCHTCVHSEPGQAESTGIEP